ncbi:MAG: hypothetical protein HOJ35_08595, partial [Bdellovibrionales bacterium]|nr:hypothetical protein [Bdellovibrionales bacterium]
MNYNFAKLRELEKNESESIDFLDSLFSSNRFYVKNHTKKMQNDIDSEKKKTFKSLE